MFIDFMTKLDINAQGDAIEINVLKIKKMS